MAQEFDNRRQEEMESQLQELLFQEEHRQQVMMDDKLTTIGVTKQP